MKIDPDFALKIRQALNEGADQLDYKTQFRLQQARKRALAQFADLSPVTINVPATELVLADSSGGRWGWAHRLGFLIPALALIIGFVFIQQWRQTQRINDQADIDFAVLLDEGPLEAYADRGFGRFIQQELND